MNSNLKHCFLIGGTGSGVGKTTLTLGLSRAIHNRNKKVTNFKVGPDFLDPSYLSLASKNECFNLDSWMTNGDYVKNLFKNVSHDSDVSIVEGVMGLFDGASMTSFAGSSAEIAQILDIPVLLVVNAKGAARSVCAMVKGFVDFIPELKFAGVIANRVGSASHGKIIKEALEYDGLPPMVGAIPNDGLAHLESRHLGLVNAMEVEKIDSLINEIASQIEEYIDIDKLLELTGKNVSYKKENPITAKKIIKLAVAKDNAFQFTYPDNIQALERSGVEIEYFSPLKDAVIPSDCNGVYLPGGYPELYAKELSANTSMIKSIGEFAENNGAVLGECGGFLYLCNNLTTTDGKNFEFCNLFNLNAEMQNKFRRLGYGEAEFKSNNPFGMVAGLKGHVFHYSKIEDNNLETEFVFKKRKDNIQEGYKYKNVFASYVHFHFASNEQAIKNLINYFLNTGVKS